MEQKTKANAEADAALGQRLDALQQTLDARVKAATEAVQAATQASRTAAEAGQAQAAEAAKAIDRRLQEQADQIAALDKSVAQRAEVGTVQAALRVVAADRVPSALESGDALCRAAGHPAQARSGDARRRPTALAPFAGPGAPTAGQLADGVPADRRADRRQAPGAAGQERGRDRRFTLQLLSMADGDRAGAQGRRAGGRRGRPTIRRPRFRPPSTAATCRRRGAAFAALPAAAQDEAGDFGAKLKARAAAEHGRADAAAETAFKALPTGHAAAPADARRGAGAIGS